MPKPSVLVVGSSNTDMIVKVDRLPQPGETLLGGEFALASGGKGANQAVAAARAGGAVTLIARIGKDVFGQMALDAFKSNRIDTEYVVHDRANPSGVALIFVAKNGQNSIAVAPGANSGLNVADVRKAKNAFRKASVLLLQLETPLKTVRAAAELATEIGTRVILNPAPAQALPSNLLKGLFLLTPNETEVQLLTRITVDREESADRAASKLLAQGIRNVIITMGARGAFVAGKSIRQFIPAYKVKAVDATGAGDIFNGALAVAISEGKSLLDAAAFANAAAALSVTRLGAQTSAPSRHEIEQLLATGKVPRSAAGAARGHNCNGSNGWARLAISAVKKNRKILAGLKPTP
jgi:ribokinase